MLVIKMIVLLALISQGVYLMLWYLAAYFDMTPRRAGKALLCVTVLTSIDLATMIYDPYRPHTSTLSPQDWQGWPPHALELQHTVAPMLACGWPSGDDLRLGHAIVHLVDDRAAVFAYQPADAQALHDLRDRYALPTLVQGQPSQLAALLVLNDWVRRHWQHGLTGAVDFRRFYAGQILEAGPKGAQYWCHVAAMTFIQVVAAVGYQARLVSLSYDRATTRHAVVEIWVDDLDKWIVVDTDLNLHYRDDSGSPLNALELHKACVNGGAAGISIVKGPYTPEKLADEDTRTLPRMLRYYRYFYVDMRNDWMTNVYFRGHPRRSDRATLRWQEPEERGFLDRIPVTADASALYWPLNHVEVRLGVDAEVTVRTSLAVYLKTITPNFDHFEIRMDDSAGVAHRSSQVQWPLRPGRNFLTVRAVNMFGVKGPPSRIELLCGRAYLDLPSIEDLEKHRPSRPAHGAAHQVQAGHRRQDRPGPGPHDPLVRWK